MSNSPVSDNLGEDAYRSSYVTSRGIRTIDRPNDGEFHVEFLSSGAVLFPGDEVLYELDAACVELHDAFRLKVFPDTEKYYRDLRMLPIWVRSAGLASDGPTSRNDFEQIMQDVIDTSSSDTGSLSKAEELNRHLYLADSLALVTALQNRSVEVKWDLVSFFRDLGDFFPDPRAMRSPDECIYWTSGDGLPSRVFSLLTSGIVKLYSLLDLVTKVVTEWHLLATDFSRYPRIKSKDVLYGKSSVPDLSAIQPASDPSFRHLLILRNELIHSGGWEPSPKIFYRATAGVVQEKWILLPDCDKSGAIETYKNRRLFFARNQRANVTFPALCLTVWRAVTSIISKLNETYSKTTAGLP